MDVPTVLHLVLMGAKWLLMASRVLWTLAAAVRSRANLCKRSPTEDILRRYMTTALRLRRRRKSLKCTRNARFEWQAVQGHVHASLQVIALYGQSGQQLAGARARGHALDPLALQRVLQRVHRTCGTQPVTYITSAGASAQDAMPLPNASAHASAQQARPPGAHPPARRPPAPPPAGTAPPGRPPRPPPRLPRRASASLAAARSAACARPRHPLQRPQLRGPGWWHAAGMRPSSTERWREGCCACLRPRPPPAAPAGARARARPASRAPPRRRPPAAARALRRCAAGKAPARSAAGPPAQPSSGLRRRCRE